MVTFDVLSSVSDMVFGKRDENKNEEAQMPVTEERRSSRIYKAKEVKNRQPEKSTELRRVPEDKKTEPDEDHESCKVLGKKADSAVPKLSEVGAQAVRMYQKESCLYVMFS